MTDLPTAPESTEQDAPVPWGISALLALERKRVVQALVALLCGVILFFDADVAASDFFSSGLVIWLSGKLIDLSRSRPYRTLEHEFGALIDTLDLEQEPTGSLPTGVVGRWTGMLADAPENLDIHLPASFDRVPSEDGSELWVSRKLGATVRRTGLALRLEKISDPKALPPETTP